MEHNSAKAEILEEFPGARVVRDVFGLVVTTDEDGGTRIGEGRAYYEEEAWISAVESEAWRARDSGARISPAVPRPRGDEGKGS